MYVASQMLEDNTDVMDRHFVLFIMLFLIINSTYFIVRGAAGPRGVNVP